MAELENRLAQDPLGWDGLLKQTTLRHLHVRFPQLAKESHLNLGPALVKVKTSSRSTADPVDLAQLFDAKSADFGAINPSRPLFLSGLAQMVELDINSVASQSVGNAHILSNIYDCIVNDVAVLTALSFHCCVLRN